MALAFGVVICAHELCHIAGYRFYKLPFTVKLKTCAIVVESEHFAGPFRKLPRKKQEQYTLIAMLPYLVLVPFIALLSTWDVVVAGFLLISQTINMPLEFGLY